MAYRTLILLIVHLLALPNDGSARGNSCAARHVPTVLLMATELKCGVTRNLAIKQCMKKDSLTATSVVGLSDLKVHIKPENKGGQWSHA